MYNKIKKQITMGVTSLIIGLTCFEQALAFGKHTEIQEIEPAKYQEREVMLPTKSIEQLTTVIDNITKWYVKSVTPTKLMELAIKGMLAQLDPHSEYLDAEGLRDLKMETTGKFGGIGVQIVPENGVIKVVTPLDGTPAYRAGIKSGDYIIQINNKSVADMTLSEARNLMSGLRGSKLSLTIVRQDRSKPFVVNLRREIIRTQSTVKSSLLENGYGYIRLSVFQESTELDLVQAIKRLQKMSRGNLRGVVIDVRNNPGGLVDSAVNIANDFLDASKFTGGKPGKKLQSSELAAYNVQNQSANKLIVYAKGQNNEIQLVAEASAGELIPGVPIVVLINEGSASAAEIVAGALQDHKRAIIVGTRSFGKGTVQTILPINDTSAIKLTTAIYYTPLGRSIQARGIEPDITVEDMQIPRSQEPALPRLDESALIDHIKNEEDKEGLGAKLMQQARKSQPEISLAYKDYQLYEALHILKSLSMVKYKTMQS